MTRLGKRVRVIGAVLACAALLGACSAQLGEEDLDPATTLADEEWWDEGPPPEEEGPATADDGLATASSELTGAPRFQLPFPCGQVWAGQTRADHNPQRAIDFNRSNDVGDPVVAAAAGTVTRVGNLGSVSYGRWIEIDHGNGYRTRYAHLASQAVAVGQRVSQAQRIGTVGSTGGSSGPHLHYELRSSGTPIRPVFNGTTAYFYGTRNYTSQNACGGGTTSVVGRVNTSGAPLTVRSGPGTGYGAVGSVADGATVRIGCQKYGQTIAGPYGTSSIWDSIGSGYVSDAYVSTGSDGLVTSLCR